MASHCQPVLETSTGTHPFFNHQQTPEGRHILPFMSALGRQSPKNSSCHKTNCHKTYLDYCNTLLGNRQLVCQVFNMIEVIVLRVHCDSKYWFARVLIAKSQQTTQGTNTTIKQFTVLALLVLRIMPALLQCLHHVTILVIIIIIKRHIVLITF